MEWLKNIVTPFSERVKSPFYSSLIVAWLVFNWRIVVALFFYDELVNNQDKISYIMGLLNEIRISIIYPLVSAAIYLFALPWIDEYIFGYVERFKQRKLEKKIAITKAGKVDGVRHIDLYNRYMKQKDELAKVEDDLRAQQEDIDKIKEERDKLYRDIITQEDNYQSKAKELHLFYARNDIKNFPHRNMFYLQISETASLLTKEDFYCTFQQHAIIEINPQNENTQTEKYKIVWFEYVETEKHLRCLCLTKNENHPFNEFTSLFFDLRCNVGNIYEGNLKILELKQDFSVKMSVV